MDASGALWVRANSSARAYGRLYFITVSIASTSCTASKRVVTQRDIKVRMLGDNNIVSAMQGAMDCPAEFVASNVGAAYDPAAPPQLYVDQDDVTPGAIATSVVSSWAKFLDRCNDTSVTHTFCDLTRKQIVLIVDHVSWQR